MAKRPSRDTATPRRRKTSTLGDRSPSLGEPRSPLGHHPSEFDDAQAQGAEEAEGQPEEGHPGAPHSTSGTLSSDDQDRFPVVDSGVSVGPEDLGRQFLRDATEQDNFESSVTDDDLEPGAVRVGQMVSQATLISAGQKDVELPGSGALGTTQDFDEPITEPSEREVDLLSSSIHEGSLFDQPTERGGTRAPVVNADEQDHEPGKVDPEARERAVRDARATLRKLRPSHERR